MSHEFLCFNRPMVFLDPRILPIGQDKTWMWQCGRVVRRRGGVWPAIAEELAHPDRFAAPRQRLLGEAFYQPDGFAARGRRMRFWPNLAGKVTNEAPDQTA